MDLLKDILKYSKGQRGVWKDWRAQKMLQKYDKDLVVQYLYDKDRWSIWTKDRKGKEYLVFIVSNKDGTYRRIDCRDLQAIVRADLTRKERSYSLWKEIESHNANLEWKQARQLRKDIEAISRERWRYSVGHPQIKAGL